MTSTLLRTSLMTALLCIPALSFAKRLPPAPVPDVYFENIRYIAEHRFEDGGYVKTMQVTNGETTGSTRIYKTRYRPNLEQDVQDVFIKSIVLDIGTRKLFISNERDEIYSLNIDTQEVERIFFNDQW